MIYITPPVGKPGLQFVDRGDIDAYDFTKTTLTADNVWNDMDLSSIVGEGIRLILIRIGIQQDASGKKFDLRTKGYTYLYNMRALYTQVANKLIEKDVWILTDASGVIQYRAQAVTWDFINIVVRGWYVL